MSSLLPHTKDLVQLAAALSQAKIAEARAKRARIEAEENIIRHVDFKKPDGQEAFAHESEHGHCKVTIKQPVSTTVDSDKWVKLRRSLSKDHPGRAVFVAKYSLDTKKARELQETTPTAWATISEVVTRKPGKIGVELQEVVAITQDEVT